MQDALSETPPLVSIVVRSMGRPSLADALASLARQSHRPLEAVVVDATGGRHPPLPLLPEALDVRLVSAGQRLNRASAANFGLAHARGSWLGFLDDDDTLNAEHIACLVSRARRDDAPDLVHVGAWLLDRFHRLTGERHAPVNRLMLYYDGPFTIMSALFHRRHWERGCRFHDELEVFEDWDFWLQLLPQARVAMVDDLTQLYFQEAGDSGTSIGHNADRVRTRRFVDLLKQRWAARRDAEWGDYLGRLQIGMQLQSAGRFDEARRHCAQLLAEFRDEPNALFVLAQVFARQGLLYSARRMLGRALTRNPQAAEYWQLLAGLEERLGNAAGAIDAWREALSFKPALAPEAEKAMRALRARSAAPSAAAASTATSASTASSASTAAVVAPAPRAAAFAAFGAPAAFPGFGAKPSAPLPTLPPGDLAQLRQQALQAYRSGELSAARLGYEAILTRTPDDAEALQALARLAFDAGDLAASASRLAALPAAWRASYDNRRLSRRIERALWTRSENARVFERIARLPFLLDAATAGIAATAAPRVHLLLPAADRERRLALPTAALIERVLDGHADVHRWLCEGQAGVWGTIEAGACAALPIDAVQGRYPQGGTLVFCGVPEAPPAWLRTGGAARILIVPLAADAGDLLELAVNAHHQSGAPVGIVLAERSVLRDGNAPDAFGPEGSGKADDGEGGPSAGIFTVLYPPIDVVAELRRQPAAADPARPFIIGCMAAPGPEPFHPDAAALWRRLAAMGVQLRVAGGASLERHFPPTQPLAGMTLLPERAADSAGLPGDIDVLLVRDGPHRLRGTGTPIARALARGVPVLAGRGSADSGLIVDGRNGWLFDGNDQAAALVGRLLRDRAACAAAGAAARADAQRWFGGEYLRRLRRLLAGG